MKPQHYRSAGWAAVLSGVAAILALVTLVLFFAIEVNTGGEHLWGPLSDLFPIIQMALLLVVARTLYLAHRAAAPRLSLIATVIGMAGMAGVIVLQVLLRMDVLPFEQEVRPLLVAFGLVGVWLMAANDVGRRQRSLPSRLAWLGMAVGAAFVLEPVIVFVVGGADWSAYMSNPLLTVISAIVFLTVYFGYPVWVIWLGRVLLKAEKFETGQQQLDLIPQQ
ncbi:MAG: hypothetical protein K1X65_13310 [Caldilineales bacterium]|nr:hypothetical protein [Caldilineales bacterium]